TDIQGLGEAFKYVGPIASDLGISIEDTAAAIGVLGDAGIQGGQAGRQLRSGLQSLAAPTSQASKLMNDLGIEVFDAEGNMKSMPAVVKELEKGLGGMSAQQKAAALETLFGADAMSAWSVLVNEGSDELGDFSDEVKNSEGAAGDMAETTEDNLAGSMRSLKSALEVAAIGLSELGEGPMRTVIEKATELIRWFDGLSDSTKQWIILIAGVSALIGPFLLILGTMITMIPNLVAGIKFLGIVIGALTSPIGIVVASIIGAASLIYVYWEPIKEFFAGLWESIQEITTIAWEGLGEIWGNAKESFIEAWNAIPEFFVELWESIKEIFMGVYEWIDEKTNGSLTRFVSIIETSFLIASGIIQDTWEFIKDTFTNALDFLVALVMLDFEGMKTAMGNQMESARGLLSNIWSRIKENVSSKLQEKLAEIKNKFTEMVATVKQKATEILEAIKTKFEEVKQAVKTKMTEAVTILGQKVGEMPAKIISFVPEVFEAGKGLVSGMINGIKVMASDAINAIAGVVDGVVNKAKSLLSINSPSLVFRDIGHSVGEGLTGGVLSMAKDARNASNTMIDSLIPDARSTDIGGRIDSINARASKGLNQTLNSEVSVSKQPAYITLRLENNDFVAFVDDIEKVQDRKELSRLRARGRQ